MSYDRNGGVGYGAADYLPGIGYTNYYQPSQMPYLRTVHIDGAGNHVGTIQDNIGSDGPIGIRRPNGQLLTISTFDVHYFTMNSLGVCAAVRELPHPGAEGWIVGPSQTPIRVQHLSTQGDTLHAIADDGIAGGSIFAPAPVPGFSFTGRVPVLWNNNGTLRRVLTSPGMVEGGVADINRVGEAAGLIRKGGGEEDWYAAVWDVNTGELKREVRIGRLLQGSQSSFPDHFLHINDLGECIVTQSASALQTSVSYWSSMTGLVPMRPRISGLPSGAELSVVRGFDEQGRVAAYFRSASGGLLRGYYLEPVPEPMSLLGLALGGSLLLQRRRRD